MAKYSINDTTLSNIASPIKTLMGLSSGLTPEEMVVQLNEANTHVSNALTKISEKGVTVPDGSGVGALAELIDAIETGGNTLETCTVTITDTIGGIADIIATVFDGTSVTSQSVYDGSYDMSVEIVKGSAVTILTSRTAINVSMSEAEGEVIGTNGAFVIRVDGDSKIYVRYSG